MLEIGVQSKNVIEDTHPEDGFRIVSNAGFHNVDFSLNGYLLNTDLYQNQLNTFFSQSMNELEAFFTPHKKAAEATGVTINQMHMPYPIYIPHGKKEVNEYLWNEVAPKSMQVCAFFDCPYIVIHGVKMDRFLWTEEEEWAQTERYIDYLAPMAKELGITLCIENLYTGIGGHLLEGPCCNAREAAQRIDRINDRYHAEVLGFCFDTGHANLVGIDFEDFLTTLDFRLKVLHIHDNDGISDLHQIPYTFAKIRENRSSTDWQGFLRGISKIGFDKVLSFETAPVLTAFPEELKEETVRFIAKIGTFFSQQIEYERVKTILRREPCEENLWNAIVVFQNYPLKTAKGLPFQFRLNVGKRGEYTKELIVDRRENSKSLTWSSVMLAFWNLNEAGIGTLIERPKALGDIRGISYIYSIFYALELLKVPEKFEAQMRS